MSHVYYTNLSHSGSKVSLRVQMVAVLALYLHNVSVIQLCVCVCVCHTYIHTLALYLHNGPCNRHAAAAYETDTWAMRHENAFDVKHVSFDTQQVSFDT
jgi:hypothetical protein